MVSSPAVTPISAVPCNGLASKRHVRLFSIEATGRRIVLEDSCGCSFYVVTENVAGCGKVAQRQHVRSNVLLQIHIWCQSSAEAHDVGRFISE